MGAQTTLNASVVHWFERGRPHPLIISLERQLHFGSSFSMIVALFVTCLETMINYYSKQYTCTFDNPETRFSCANYRQLLSCNVTVMTQFLGKGRLTKPALNA